ncbi:MAG: ribosome silencing factor [Mycetocola sp.]
MTLPIREQLRLSVAAAERTGGEDAVALDVSGPLPFVDTFFLVTAKSERGVSAVAREIEDALNDAGVKTLRREGREAGRWALLDFGDLVAHVFHEEERSFYALDRLWSDCPVIPLDDAATVAASAEY